MGSPVTVDGAGDLSAGLTDAVLTLLVLLSWAATTNGLERGLVYFSGLAAFASQFGANASVVLGVLLANAATGGGLDLGQGALVAVAAPLATAALAPTILAHGGAMLQKLTAGLNPSMMPELLGQQLQEPRTRCPASPGLDPVLRTPLPRCQHRVRVLQAPASSV